MTTHTALATNWTRSTVAALTTEALDDLAHALRAAERAAYSTRNARQMRRAQDLMETVVYPEQDRRRKAA